ncbi:MAG: rod shape-determining protein MreC [Pyrinomonadaceae bacterium]
MVARSQKEIRQRAPLWLLMLLVVNLGLMSYDARDDMTKQRMIRVWAQSIAAPFQYVSSWIGGTGAGFFHRVANMRGLEAENAQLRARVEQMENATRDARAALDENERLKGLLNLKETSSYEVVAARVIARDPSMWFDTVTINRGRSSGIALNMPVVTSGGIVGRVVATSPWTAQVMLITDEKAAAGAVVGQLGQSNALGSVKGLGESGLVEMDYVSGMEEVKIGDYVTTTGQDGIYPEGLNVGEVVKVKHGTATAPHVIHVKPSARLDALEEVGVLLYHPPPRTAPDQALPNVEKKKG